MVFNQSITINLTNIGQPQYIDLTKITDDAIKQVCTQYPLLLYIIMILGFIAMLIWFAFPDWELRESFGTTGLSTLLISIFIYSPYMLGYTTNTAEVLCAVMVLVGIAMWYRIKGWKKIR